MRQLDAEAMFRELTTREDFDAIEPVVMAPEEVTADWLRADGLKKPVLVHAAPHAVRAPLRPPRPLGYCRTPPTVGLTVGWRAASYVWFCRSGGAFIGQSILFAPRESPWCAACGPFAGE